MEEAQAAEAREKAHAAAQEEAVRAKARQAALSNALQELLVFKSRADVQTLEAQDTARRMQDELDALTKRYDTVSGSTHAQTAWGMPS